MKIHLFLCAKEFVIDQASNRISAFNLYEEVISPAFPLVLSQFAVLMAATRDDNDPASVETNLSITLDNDTLYSAPWIAEFRGTRRVRSMIQFGMVPIAHPGNLTATVSKGDQTLMSYTVPITLAGPIEAKPKEPATDAASTLASAEVKPEGDTSARHRRDTSTPEKATRPRKRKSAGDRGG